MALSLAALDIKYKKIYDSNNNAFFSFEFGIISDQIKKISAIPFTISWNNHAKSNKLTVPRKYIQKKLQGLMELHMVNSFP